MTQQQTVTLPFKPGAKVLEVGGGDQPYFRPNLDMRKLPTVDYVCNLEDKWPVPDNSFDGVFGKFVVEHMSWRKTGHFAEQCFRVLKPGGCTFLIGPNTLEQCKEIARLNRIGIEESALLYGGQEEPLWNEHKAAFSPEYAFKIYKKAGFQRVEIETWPGQIWTGARTDMVIKAYKAEQPSNVVSQIAETPLVQQNWYKEMEQKMTDIRQNVNQPMAGVIGQDSRKVGLNIGSFTVMLKNSERIHWINTDILDMSQWASQHGFEFKQFDARQTIPWLDASVDYIIAYHFLEHITRAEGTIFLKECLRVIKPGGVIRIGVPDTKIIVQAYIDGKIREFNANEGVAKAEDHSEAFWNLLTAGHLTAYDEDSLGNKVITAGFKAMQCESGESNIPEIITDTKDMYAGTDMLRLPPHTLYVEGVKAGATTARPAPTISKSSLDRIEWAKEQIRGARSIVDIGCFDAPVTRGLNNCTWVDVLSYDQITELGKQPPPFPRDKFVQTDATRLPFADKEFGVAIICDVLEHVALPTAVLKQAARVAEKVIITVPNEYDWEQRHGPFTNPGNARTYTEQTLKADLDKAGYKDYKIGRLDYAGWSFYTVVAKTTTEQTAVGADKRGGTPIAKPYSAEEADKILTRNADEAIGVVNRMSVVAGTPVKLRIGLISTQFFGVPPKGYSGLEMIVWDLACGLSELGHTVTLFAPEGSKPPQNGKVVFTGPALQTTTVDWLGSEQAAYEVYKAHLNQLDIIHGHNWFGFEYLAKANNGKLRVCHTHHGHMDPNYWLRNRAPFKLNFIGISKHMQDEYRQQGLESRYVYNGIDLGKYKFQKEKGDRLLFVGRLSPIKQPHVAIQIARQLGMGLDIVGGTFVAPQEVQYMEQIKAAADGKQIVLYADAPHEKKVELMQNAKCLIFPSNMGEPFGLVAAEAMACGTPVVSTADGAIGEVVENGLTGYVCNTVEQMIGALQPVNLDHIKPESCHKRVEENFSREAMAKGYEQLYRDILEGCEW